MKKNEAHQHLDRLKAGHFVRMALTVEALQATGDIPRVSDKSLCFDSDEQRVDRPCALHDTPVSKRFSYSIYLDSPKNERVTQ